ncbi:FecR family protein [Pseudobacter ginsenosidimutans]|uniref:FecR family protein n=1 Tax=Pseudobacter ginsenosidimutans TaxID=661488 RepID=A0A4Q7N3B8_9BACT|nr:FecR family protein [Pseudobacter ginsenosidimutans]RZS75155.1 FecR family protein [Pseudobacter ginsenosidimutans]
MNLHERLQYLYDRYETGACTHRERLELMELAAMPEHEAFFKERIDAAMINVAYDEATILSLLPNKRAEEIFEEILRQPVLVRRKALTLRYWAAAAAILLVLAAGAYLWFSSTASKMGPQSSLAMEIMPGKDGAILTLADGKQIVLDSIASGIIGSQNGAQLTLTNGQLAYGSSGQINHTMEYNTISTPKGRQFRLLLSDGTMVWLNAASSLKYPTIFTGKERQVTVSGEVYFEVAKNTKMPFRVSVNEKATIDVLGTSFNVEAYSNEGAINTTLLEGSIRAAVVPAGVGGNAANKVLKPGQQAQISNTPTDPGAVPGITVIDNIDIEKVMAWKNGFFNFEGASLAEVMKQLERWYDIEVIYEKGIPDKKLMGKMTRDITLNGLLAGLEELGIHGRLEGRKLTILP